MLFPDSALDTDTESVSASGVGSDLASDSEEPFDPELGSVFEKRSSFSAQEHKYEVNTVIFALYTNWQHLIEL